MSKIFYDHLLDLGKVDKRIKAIAKTPEEREELWLIIDEILHNRVLAKLLTHLPKEHHEEFLSLYHKKPHDEGLLNYLGDKIKGDVIEFIKDESLVIGYEILDELSARRLSK